MKVHYVLLMMILSVTLTSCVETIVMAPDDKDLPVVVNCILKSNFSGSIYHPTNQQTEPQKQSVTVRYAKGKSEKDFIPIGDATVYIKYVSESSGKEEALSFSYLEDGKYESDSPLLIQKDTKYTLYVEIPGREMIWASTVSPPQLKQRLNPLMSHDIPDNNTYYLQRFRFIGWEYANEEDSRPQLVELPQYAAWIYAQEYSEVGWVDLDYLVSNCPDADDFNIIEGKFSGLDILGEEKDENDSYLRHDFERTRSLVSDLPLHDKFIRIYNLDSDVYFFIKGGPVWYLNLKDNDYFGQGIRNGKQMDYFCLVCHLLSNNLDTFLRDLYVHEHRLDNYMTAVYSSPSIYTNIHGGLGIFGCDCTYWIYSSSYLL